MAATAEHPLVDVRADFPVLDREIDGRRVVYLDSAATAQRPRQVIEAMDEFQRVLLRADPPRRVRAGARGDRGLRGRPRQDRRVRRLGSRLLDLHPQRHRGDQPGRLRVGPRERRPRRRGAHHGDGAPLEHRALAAALRGDGSAAALPHGVRERRAVARRARLGAGRGPGEARGVAHISNVLGTINPVAEIVRRARAAGAVTRRRRRAGGAADAGRPRRAGRRLLRLDRPQGARTDDRHAARPARAPRRRCGRSSAAGT